MWLKAYSVIEGYGAPWEGALCLALYPSPTSLIIHGSPSMSHAMVCMFLATAPYIQIYIYIYMYILDIYLK